MLYPTWHLKVRLTLQFSSVTQLCLTLCDPMDCSTPSFPVHHQLLELTQTHVHRVVFAIQPSYPLLSPSPPTFNLSQHQALLKWISSLHQVASVLEFLIPKKGNAKECSNYHTIALISQPSKVMLKILQARLHQYVNHELSDVQAGFWKGRGTRDQITNILQITEKTREFQRKIYFCFNDYDKAFDCVDHNKLWKIFK